MDVEKICEIDDRASLRQAPRVYVTYFIVGSLASSGAKDGI